MARFVARLMIASSALMIGAAALAPSGAGAGAPGPRALPPGELSYVAVTPARVLDTRVGFPTVDGVSAGGGAVGPASSINLKVTGRGGVPTTGVAAVVLNVTAVNQTLQTFITAHPAGSARPNAANLNPIPGIIGPNLVVVKVGTNGEVTLYNNSGSVDLVADVQGWFRDGSNYTGLTPARIMDTRPGSTTIDGGAAGIGPTGPGAITNLRVTGRGGVPSSGVSAVIVNVTPVGHTAETYVTVFPKGATRPLAANLNPIPGQVRPNLVIAKVGDDGEISLFNFAGSVNLVVDVQGWFSTSPPYNALVPSRLLDTRTGEPTVDGLGSGAGPLGPTSVIDVKVTGRDGVPPSGVGAVVLNVTATEQTALSFLTVFPKGAPRPIAANLNPNPGITAPNLVIAKVGAGGEISIYNHSGSVHLVVDVQGWFPSESVANADAATVAEDSAATAIDVLANDTDADGPITIASVAQPANGTVVLTGGPVLPPARTGLTYRPNANFCGIDTFVYTLNGGLTATVTVTVTCVDDPPIAVASSAFTAEDTAVAVDVLANDTDIDGGPKTVVTAGAANGAVTVTGGGSGVSYQPPLDFCGGTVTFTYTLNGGSSATVTVTVTCVNDRPVVTPAAGSTPYTEQAASVAADPLVTVSDVDDADLEAAQVRVLGGFQAGDSLTFTPQAGISGLYNPASGILVFTGSAPKADYQTVLRSVRFASTSDDPPSTKTIQYMVNDGAADSLLTTKTIAITAVNDAPVIAGITTTLAYTEDDGPVAPQPTLTITDPDSPTMNGAVLQIAVGYVQGEDVLAFTNQNGITGVFTPATGALNLLGTASRAEYEAAIRSVTYLDGSQDPTAGIRDVGVIVDDGGVVANLSNVVTRSIDVTPVNDAPVVSPTPGNAAYVENAAATDVDTTITVGDVDDPNIVSLEVSVTGGFEPGADVLDIPSPGTLTVNYNGVTGVLTITGNEPLGNYQAALRSLTFASTSDDPPATKTLQFVANDGVDASSPTTKVIDVIAVNDPPTIVTSAGSTGYTENGASVVVDPSVTITDPDDTHLVYAALDIVVLFVDAGDEFAFTDTADIQGLTLCGCPGFIELVGNATLAEWEAAIESIVFSSTSNAPTTPKPVAIVVSDGDDVSPAAVKTIDVTAVNDAPTGTDTTLTIVEDVPYTFSAADFGFDDSVDDPPANSLLAVRITTLPTTGTLTVGGNPVAAGDTIAVADIPTLVHTPAADANGPAAAILTFQVRDDGGTVNGGVDLDPSANTITFDVTPLNDAPGVDLNSGTAGNDTSVTFNEVIAHDNSVDVAPTAAVADVDDADLEGGVITLTNHPDGPAEDLAIDTTGTSIVATPDANNWTITLTGTDTRANYETVLRTVTYSNTAAPPTVTDRIITFVVADGDTNSVSRTATVTVVPLNVPPALDLDSANAGSLDSSAAFTEDGGAVQIAPNADVTDVDDANIDSATATLTNRPDGVAESLSTVTAGTSISANYTPATGVLALTGSDTKANYDTVISAISYGNTAQAPDTTSRTITVVVNDGAADSNTATATVSVAATNDAPVLDPARTPALAPVTEDSGAPSGAVGSLVSDLVDFASPAGQVDNVTDPDAAPLLGIAVTAASSANGSWFHTLDGGANWLPLGVSVGNSRLLAADANTRLYFQPNADFSGTIAAAITFRAWDRTAGSAGTLADTAVNGGSTAFSSATDTAAITVVGVNDAPVLDATKAPTLTAQAEDDGAPTGAVGTLVATLADLTTPAGGLDNVTDVDAGALTGIAVTDAATANGSWHFSLDDGANWLPLGAVSASNARLLAADADNRLYFQPAADFNGLLDPGITFRAWDRTSGSDGDLVDPTPTGGTAAFSTLTDTAALTIAAVNDAPVLDASKSPVLADVAEDPGAPVNGVAGGTPVASLVDFATPAGGLDNVMDIDAGAVLGVAITSADTTDGTWFVSIDDGATWQALGAVTNTNARLLAVGAGATTGRIYFQPDANFNGSVPTAITFRAWDTSSGVNGSLTTTVPNGGTSPFSSSTDTAALTVTPVNDAPVAAVDSFDTIGNTELRVDLAGAATPHATETTAGGNGATNNDSDPVEGDPFTVTGLLGCAVPDLSAPFDCVIAGQHVMMESDGDFSYVPAPGATTGTFQYTITDQPAVGMGTPESATGTVNMALLDMVWYVDGAAPGGGSGTSESPLNSFTGINGAGGAGDADAVDHHIYVHSSTVTSSIELEGGQFLWGEAYGLSLPVNLNGNGSPTLLEAAGTRPTVTAAANTITAGAAFPAEIRGLSIVSTGALTNAIDVTTAGALGGATSLVIDGNTFAGATGETIDVNVDVGTTGSRILTISNNTWSSGHASTGIDVEVGAAGSTLNLDLDANVLQSNGHAIEVLEASGVVNVRSMAGNTVSGASSGSGIVMTGPTFDADPVTGGVQQVAGGTTAIGSLADRIGGGGISLLSVNGSLGFTDLDVYTQAGGALAVSAPGIDGMALSTTPGTSVLDAIGGPGLDLANVNATLVLSDLESQNSPITGLNLVNVNGTVTAPTGSAITSATGNDVSISGGAAAVTYDGTITDDVGTLVNVSNATGGTKDFNGAITDGNDGDGSGIVLGNNGAATIRFDGGLTLSTGANAAFSATGGGTVVVTDPAGAAANTIATTTGTALNVSNTTIGADNLTFQSISANGAPNGILLNSSGTAGGLLVTGNGGTCTSAVTCTGGAIQATTGAGISLTTASDVDLTRMYIGNTASHGVSGTGMTDSVGDAIPTFAFRNGLLDSPGDADNESALFFDTVGATNITGTLVLADSTIQNFEDAGLILGNVSGTLTVTATNLIVDDNSDATGEEGIDIDASGTATINVNVSGTSVFRDLEGGGFNVVAQGSGTIDLNIDNVTVIGTGGPDNFPTPPAMTFSAESATSNFFFDITNNRILDSSGDGIFVGHEGEIMGRITGNTITGMGTGDGIRIDTDTTSNQTSTILIDNNSIGTAFLFEAVNHSGIADDGIQVLHRDGTKALNLTITNNQIANVVSEGIRYFTDDDVAGGGPENALKIEGNTFSAITDPNTIFLVSQDSGTNLCAHISNNTLSTGNLGIVLQQSLSAVLQITQGSTAALGGANDAGATVVTPTGTVTFNGACTNPPLPTNP